MVTSNNKVYVFGGSLSRKDIFRLDCGDTLESCTWVQHGTMEYGRHGHSVIPISSTIVKALCEGDQTCKPGYFGEGCKNGEYFLNFSRHAQKYSGN